MVFKICVVDGEIQFDALPVGKIIEYPLEQRDFKPFTQFRICINQAGLHLQLWAFEVNQSKDSEIKAVLNLNPEQEKYLDVTISGDYKTKLTIQNGSTSEDISHKLSVHHLDGEDLQGIYWGASILVPMETIKKVFDKTEFTLEDTIKGNLFKINSADVGGHYGCYFTADFKSAKPYGSDFFGDFPIFLY